MRTPALSILASLLLTTGVAAEATTSPSAALAKEGAASLALPATNDGLPGQGPIRRYDWFQKLWTERRATFARRVESDQRSIVFLGDSITQGWHDNFDDAFPGLRTANRGIAGDTTRGMLLRLRDDVLALHPAAVVLLAGTNDLDEPGGNPWLAASNLRLILEALRDHNPAMPVIVCEVFPSSPVKNRPAHQIRRLNQLIREATADLPQVMMLDTWKLFAGPDNNATPDEFPDLLHPNNAGYAKWAAALRPLFATLGYLERDADNFTIENDFESLFNGHDLTGWGYRPSTPQDLASARGWQAGDLLAAEWPMVKEAAAFAGLTSSPDGRYQALRGRLIVRPPRGQRTVQQLWTTREFPGNFVLRLQFRATPNADSGVYVRGPQLQCRDYLLAGPYTKLAHYRPLDWNDLEITVRDGVARATCNGEVLEEAMPVPATGPLGLEADNGQMEYRRLRMMTLP